MTAVTTTQSDIRTNALPPVILPEGHNYIGVFLTLACNLHCSYCINRYGRLDRSGRLLTAQEWVLGLDRIVPRDDLPVTLQGGEPTLHPAFFSIVNGLRKDLQVDLLTNLEFDVKRFIREIPPERVKREAPYASVRVSYHPEVMQLDVLASKALELQDACYSIGIWGVTHPLWEQEVLRAQAYCIGRGIDFRTKAFLGEHEGRPYGVYSYSGACDRRGRREVQCRTTELLIGPGGDIYRCHSDLYEGRSPIGHILDPEFAIDPGFRQCRNYGHCNPCDVKLKTNRFQEHGHTSVEIRF